MPHLDVFSVPASTVRSCMFWEPFHPGQSRSRLNTSAERAGSSAPGRGHSQGRDCGNRPRPTWLRRIHRGLFTAATCPLLPGESLSGSPGPRLGGERPGGWQGAEPPGRRWGGGCPGGCSAAAVSPGRGSAPGTGSLSLGPRHFGLGLRCCLSAGKRGGGRRLRTARRAPEQRREPMGAGAAVWQAGRPLPPAGGEPARWRLAASSAAAGLTHASILLSPGSRSHAPRRGRSGARGAAADKAKMAGILAWFWNERFWLPHNVTWADLQSTEEAAFPQAEDLYLAFPLAFCIFMIRLLFER